MCGITVPQLVTQGGEGGLVEEWVLSGRTPPELYSGLLRFYLMVQSDKLGKSFIRTNRSHLFLVGVTLSPFLPSRLFFFDFRYFLWRPDRLLLFCDFWHSLCTQILFLILPSDDVECS